MKKRRSDRRFSPRMIDLLVTCGLILVAIPIIVIFQVRPLISTIYFFVLPSLYLMLRKPKNLIRTLAGSLLIGVVLGFSLDFLANVNHAWDYGQGQLIFGRILGVVPVDDMIWFFFWAFIIIVFYEHFLERESSDRLSKHFISAALPALIMAAGIPIIYVLRPTALYLGYAYLVLGILATLPLVVVAIKKPTLAIKFLKIAPFFVFLFLSFELTALYLNQWSFPGQYIGHVQIFSLVIPLEEFFFWIVASSTVVLSDYELAVDDMK